MIPPCSARPRGGSGRSSNQRLQTAAKLSLPSPPASGCLSCADDARRSASAGIRRDVIVPATDVVPTEADLHEVKQAAVRDRAVVVRDGVSDAG
jgi:hypothetical protein